ncbi:MAG: diguanylate cyclase response regulator, partial [Rhodobacteraceae bacterium]|nr:diguanylate cyclase response regulator [Paracoccaceae bacterium]
MQGRLLILDPVLTNRILLNAVLEPACYQVDQAATITQGLALIRQAPPDLILAAWTLPDGTARDLRAAL